MLQLTNDNEGYIFLLNVHNHSLPHTTTVPDVLTPQALMQEVAKREIRLHILHTSLRG
jgi:hypothetical protein